MFVPLTQKLADQYGFDRFYSHELEMILHSAGYAHKWGVSQDEGYVMAVKVIDDVAYTYVFQASDALSRIHDVSMVPAGDPINGSMKINGGADTPESIMDFSVIPHVKSPVSSSFPSDYKPSDSPSKPFYKISYWDFGDSYKNWALFESVNGGSMPPSWAEHTSEILTHASLYHDIMLGWVVSNDDWNCMDLKAFIHPGAKYFYGFPASNSEDHKLWELDQARKNNIPYDEGIWESSIYEGSPTTIDAVHCITAMASALSKRGFQACVPDLAYNTVPGVMFMICHLLERTFPGDTVCLYSSTHASPAFVGKKSGRYYPSMIALSPTYYELGPDPQTALLYLQLSYTIGSQHCSVIPKHDFRTILRAFMPNTRAFMFMTSCYGLPNKMNIGPLSFTQASKEPAARSLGTVYSLLPEYSIQKEHITSKVSSGEYESGDYYTLNSRINAGAPTYGTSITATEAHNNVALRLPALNNNYAMFASVNGNATDNQGVIGFSVEQHGSAYTYSRYNSYGNSFFYGFLKNLKESPDATLKSAYNAGCKSVKEVRSEYMDILPRAINYFDNKPDISFVDALHVSTMRHSMSLLYAGRKQKPDKEVGSKFDMSRPI